MADRRFWRTILATATCCALLGGLVFGPGAQEDSVDVVPSRDLAFGAQATVSKTVAIRGQMTRLYLAYFGRQPDASGLTHWTSVRSGGEPVNSVSEQFALSVEFQNRYGNVSNSAFVELVYRNVLGRRAEAEGKRYWTLALSRGATRGEVMVGFSDSIEFVRKTGTPAPPPPEPAPVVVPVQPVAPQPVIASLPNGDTYENRRGISATSRISYPWQSQLAGWSIRFYPARSGYLGLTYPREKRIDIFVRSDQSDAYLAHVIAHEIGHAIDVTLNSSNDRTRWRSARGFDAQWWPGGPVSDFGSGAGDFAESFAYSQVGGTYYRSRLASAPSWSQRNLMAELANG